MDELIQVSVSGSTARLTLNRPEARNALSVPLIASLRGAIARTAKLDDVRVVVLTGAGRAFCAGMDLKAITGDASGATQLLADFAEATLELRALPQITIARVNGPAIGGGCGLVTVCDFAVCNADTKLGFPEVDLGICPAVVAPWLARRVGYSRARRILLSGGLMSGQQAHDWGIVTHLVTAEEELDAPVDALAARLASGGPMAVRATKKLLNEIDGSSEGDLVRRGAALSAEVVCSPATQAVLRERALKG